MIAEGAMVVLTFVVFVFAAFLVLTPLVMAVDWAARRVRAWQRRGRG